MDSKRVHFIGIGGAGLSAIALLLLERGTAVSGSDRQLSPLALRLRQAGAQVFAGHRTENVDGAGLVVRSSAIPDDNVEVQAALSAGIPVLKRADFLGRLMEGSTGVAVAGSHGKTTTTSMVAWMLTTLGRDPSYIIGGVSANLGSNAHAGHGPEFVIEADEYDRMFLGLRPQIAVVTNVEHDHPDCYPTPEDFFQAFSEFAGRILPGGLLLACTDDTGAARLLAEAKSRGQRTTAYGIEEKGAGNRGEGNRGLDYLAQNLHPNDQGGFTFELSGAPVPYPLSPVSLGVPGLHNVRNALAALGVAGELGLPLEEAAAALAEFKGAGRRFEIKGHAGGVTMIDDYGHHPTAIRATLAAARARYPGRRLWAVWQPHTYSRTMALFDDFAAAFADADLVVVTEIYPAREDPPPGGYSSRKVAEAISAGAAASHPGVHFSPGLAEARDYLLERLSPGDVLLVFSAGDADQVSVQVLERLRERETVAANVGKEGAEHA